VYADEALAEIFTPIGSSLEDGLDAVQMYMCYRHEHAPVLHIRDARFEFCFCFCYYCCRYCFVLIFLLVSFCALLWWQLIMYCMIMCICFLLESVMHSLLQHRLCVVGSLMIML